MKSSSLKINMILNSIKGMLSIIFPLISFPYVSRILGVTNIGRYNFAQSIISYILLIAALGIKTYAVREGAKIREDKDKFNHFANQMFTFNVISTIIAYVILFILMAIVSKFESYKTLLIILSLQIIFTTVGVEWIYTIYEEFLYITVRSIIFQFLSLALMFLLIKDENDLNIYAFITVLSSVGSNVMNYIHCRKYCNLRLVKNIDWNRHLKPIMVLFAMQIATTIYVSSDTTILGFICNDDIVGIYSVSTKIYSIIKNILSSVIIVSIPRLSLFLGKGNQKEFKIAARDVYSTLITVVFPAIIGIIVLRYEIVMLISDTSYISATSSLVLLCFALLFCLCAWFWGQCILVPMQKEGFVFKATVISAIINIILNFILIPIWAEKAAAFTTLVAEFVAFMMQWYKCKRYIHFEGVWKLYLKIAAGCIAIVLISILFRQFITAMIPYTILVIVTSIIVYGIIEILLKNETIYSLIVSIKKKLPF